MRFKYCPNCAGVSTMQPHMGLYKCAKCRFVGQPAEGAADEINALNKRIQSGTNPLSSPQASGSLPGASMSKEEYFSRLKKFKGKSTEDFEFL